MLLDTGAKLAKSVLIIVQIQLSVMYSILRLPINYYIIVTLNYYGHAATERDFLQTIHTIYPDTEYHHLH